MDINDKIGLKNMLDSVSSLYYDIDECIGNLVKSRMNKDTEQENKACAQMEFLLVASAQEFTCIMDFLKDLLKENEPVDLAATIEINKKMKEFETRHRSKMAMSELAIRNFHFTD